MRVIEFIEFDTTVEAGEKSVYVILGDGRDDVRAFKGLVKKLTLAGELSCNVELLLSNEKYPVENTKRTGKSVFRSIPVIIQYRLDLSKFLVFYDLEHGYDVKSAIKELNNKGFTIEDCVELVNFAYRISCTYAGRSIDIFFSIVGDANGFRCLEDCLIELLKKKGITLNFSNSSLQEAKKEIKHALRRNGFKSYEKFILDTRAEDVKKAFESLYVALKEIDKLPN